jgi:hypothetical protein
LVDERQGPDRIHRAVCETNLYSPLLTCQVNGIDCYRYLSELLIDLPKASTAEDY